MFRINEINYPNSYPEKTLLTIMKSIKLRHLLIELESFLFDKNYKSGAIIDYSKM